MLLMVAGLAVFLAVHLLPTSPEMRQGLIERYGAGPYRIAFVVLSFIGIVMIVAGFHKLQLHPAKAGPIWDPPDWTRYIAYVFMLPAFVLLAAAYTPSRIRTAVKHPMLAAIKLWALVHLIAAGKSLAAIVLFGAFLAYAVFDRISVKERQATGPLGERSGSLTGDIIAIVLGVALYAFMLLGGHELLIGVPLATGAFL